MSLSDKRAALMVLGGLMQKPDILGAGNDYPLGAEDFEEKFHKIVFGAMYNLYHNGVGTMDPAAIDSYLCNYDMQYKVFQENDGQEYLENARDMLDVGNFDYYYQRLKKFSALRFLKREGYDINRIYNDSIVSIKEREEMQAKFDEMSLKDIFDIIEIGFTKARERFIKNAGSKGQLVSAGLAELKETLKITPEIGLSLQGELVNAVTRGARLSKLYMRSGASGTGKSRLSLGNAATLACGSFYDIGLGKWISYGSQEPTLFITTELEFDEVQTPLLAFMAGVSEEHILNGVYKGNEEQRIDEAIKIYEQSKFWVEHLPNYTVSEVTDTIRRYHVLHGVKYVFFDYIHTTIKMLQDLSAQSRGMKLREDNVLAMFIASLKDLCNELGIYIETGSQLNAGWETAEGTEVNQNLLRGAKAMADKLDVGCISLPVRKEDMEILRPMVAKLSLPEPTIVTTYYKIRRSKWAGAKIWSHVDLSTCRSRDLFATDAFYNLLPIKPIKIEIGKKLTSF